MKKRNRLFAVLSGVVALTACSGVAQAQITYSTGGSLTTWNGSPNYVSLANGAALTSASTAQGAPTLGGSATFGVLAETFTPSANFILGSVGMLVSVNNVTDTGYRLNLYDLGPAGTVSVSSAAATYTPGVSLFSVNTITGLAASGGVQATFTLPVADQVNLLANEEYALELWIPVADGQNGITWFRSGTADPGGQMFDTGDSTTARATLAGNGQAGGAPRTAALALYSAAQVPEPSTLAFFAGGVLLLGAIRRFRN